MFGDFALLSLMADLADLHAGRFQSSRERRALVESALASLTHLESDAAVRALPLRKLKASLLQLR